MVMNKIMTKCTAAQLVLIIVVENDAFLKN
jgi:hypothetical protein